MEAVVDWMWRKDYIVVKEPIYIYKLDTHLLKKESMHGVGAGGGWQRENLEQTPFPAWSLIQVSIS